MIVESKKAISENKTEIEELRDNSLIILKLKYCSFIKKARA